MKKAFTLKVTAALLQMYFVCIQPAFSHSNLAELDKIYQQLIDAIGDRTSQFPQLRIISTAEMVAGYSKASNSIVIEEKAVQVCASLGDRKASALAFLLAHELTHFYQKHNWEEANFGFLVTKDRFEKGLEEEREADTYGAFIVHLAGYKITVIPDLIPELYKAYGLLNQKLDGYPTLPERQAVANEVCHKVGNLIHIFDTANYLYATGQLGQAAMSYEYLLNFVQCKELYANLGAACVAAATTAHTNQQAFLYPLSIDTNFPIRDAGNFERAELIQKAIQSLKKAVAYDPSYYDGFINLACAYDLAKDYTAATKLLQNLQPLARKTEQQAKIQIVQGIVTAHQGQKEQAAALFEQAVQQKTLAGIQQLARTNQHILVGNTQSTPISNSRGRAETNTIDGLDLKYEPEIKFDEVTILRSTDTENYQLSWKNLANSSISLYQGSHHWALQRVTRPGISTQQGIGIGSTVAQIRAAYGEVQSYVPKSNGYTMVYFDKKLLFTLNSAEKVVEWGAFALY